jgi:hypothetical protein
MTNSRLVAAATALARLSYTPSRSDAIARGWWQRRMYPSRNPGDGQCGTALLQKRQAVTGRPALKILANLVNGRATGIEHALQTRKFVLVFEVDRNPTAAFGSLTEIDLRAQ